VSGAGAAEAAGVADRVDVQLRDYRQATGRYDVVLSVEMIEAVGERYRPAYFSAIDRLRYRPLWPSRCRTMLITRPAYGCSPRCVPGHVSMPAQSYAGRHIQEAGCPERSVLPEPEFFCRARPVHGSAS
jgi:hypothetical protein